VIKNSFLEQFNVAHSYKLQVEFQDNAEQMEQQKQQQQQVAVN